MPGELTEVAALDLRMAEKLLALAVVALHDARRPDHDAAVEVQRARGNVRDAGRVLAIGQREIEIATCTAEALDELGAGP